jgi:ABC-type uncharacterized transport system substrate-binding protein
LTEIKVFAGTSLDIQGVKSFCIERELVWNSAMRVRKYFAIIGFAMALLFSGKATAHPHAWIDVSIKVVFDDQGQVTALEQTWLFDEFYSMFVMEGAMQLGGGVPSQEALDALLAENMKNLAEYRYFSEALSGETELQFAPPENAATRESHGRLEMSFKLPLQQPVAADAIPLTYAIYDPTYYIEMLHAEKSDAIVLQNAPDGCEANLIEPTPDEAEVLYAAALGQSETGFDGLGRVFAERVMVTCG